MINLTNANMKNAILRCRELKPRVRFLKDRLYIVWSKTSGNVYYVEFAVKNGFKLGKCQQVNAETGEILAPCEAYKRGRTCYHMAAGAAANIYRQGLKKGNLTLIK